MPFAEYTNFKDCVSKNQDKRDPDAYCADIKQKVEGKSFLLSSENQGFRAWGVETKAGKEYFVEGYIATHDKDRFNDVITKSAMRDIFNQADELMVDFEHEAHRDLTTGEFRDRQTLIPVAKIIDKKIDNIGVWVKAQLNHHLGEKFNIIWGSLRDGFLKAFSIAFVPAEPEDYRMEGDTRVLTRIRTLLNIALTGNPINPNATITGVVTKSMNDLFETKSEEIKMADEEKPEEKPTETPPEGEPEGEGEPKKEPEGEPETKPEGEAPKEEATETAEVKALLEEIKTQNAEIKSLISKGEPEKKEEKEESALAELKAIRKDNVEILEKLKEPVHKAEVPGEPKPEEEDIMSFIT